ncbi:hypothetical protein ETAA8_68780 [Anatilimnocola aggregata]|uniref:Uncharacterized protein n=1 Tax=Anatilimnocola aggregata TaxID=2528021 RepID=A0A517YNC6_9BACT|nr:SEC-C metal-binding domain-containing protein [Anatilimnocola aggregata]QDU31718.1 hypothetical protein ETAA8_68780 [Anatilimnocola aggregata]
MRASIERVKAALLHPELDVRNSALEYCANHWSHDESIMPIVISAYEQYGPKAFVVTHEWAKLPQNTETMNWLLQNVDKYASQLSDEVYFGRFELAAVKAVVRTIAPGMEANFAVADELPVTLRADVQRILELRSSYSQQTTAELLATTVNLCKLAATGDFSQEQWQQIECLVHEQARRPAEFAPRALAILAGQPAEGLEVSPAEDSEFDHNIVLQTMMAELAGELRLEETVPYLVEMLDSFDDGLVEAALAALKKIGTDDVARRVTAKYRESSSSRLLVIGVLESSPSELAPAALLELYSTEKDLDMRCFLLSGALQQFASEAMEPARQLLLAAQRTPETLEVHEALVVASIVLEQPFPELAEWQADMANHREYRKQYYREQPQFGSSIPGLLLDSPQSAEFGEADWHFNRSDLDVLVQPERVTAGTIHRGERVGRNDPCHCGSGKKYKKCCLRADQDVAFQM